MNMTIAESYARLLLDNIEPDPLQPRKTFESTKLNELAESIRANGVVVPIKVRPHPKKPDAYLLVNGERRWRASKLAGLDDIPAVIEQLNDKEALEQQLVENSQRADVHPLEEAEAYQSLLKNHGYTMETLITKTGRSRSHLYGRTRLLKLAPYVKKVMLDGTLDPAIGELATRIHDAKLQERFAKECLGEAANDQIYDEVGIDQEGIAEEGQPRHKQEAQPLSFRAALTLLRRRYMLRLELATFDTADASLVPSAGACITCPKRTGNQPTLPGLEKVDDLCTDPSCYETKTGARWKQAAADAAAKKIEVLDQKKAKAKNIFGWRDELNDSSPIAGLDQELPYNLRRPGTSATFGKLLGKEVANVKKVLIQDPSGAPREVLDREDAIKKLRELGKIDDGRKPKATKKEREANKAAKADRDKAKAKREITERTFLRFLEQVAAGAAKDPGTKELALWRWLARAVAREMHYGIDEKIAERRGLKNVDDLQSLGDKLKTVGEVRGFVAEVLLGQTMDRHVDGYAHKEEKQLLEDAAKIFGASWDKASEAAKLDVKLEAQATAAKDDKGAAVAKPAKKGGRK